VAQAAVLGQAQRLGQARRCSAALRRGRRVALPLIGAAAGAPQIAWARDAGDDHAILAVNAGDSAATLLMDLPAGLAGSWVDVLSGEETALPGGAWSLDLPARTARLLLPAAIWSSCGGGG
jgi:hypothetical protein